MKLQLDTDNKTIKIEDKVNLGDFVEMLEKLLPYGKWREFSLETNVSVVWNSPPIVIEPYRPWWQQPWIIYDAGTVGEPYTINSGTYNIEI
jgi:hypothetical protein